MKNAVFFCTCTDLMKSRPPDFQAIEKRLGEEGISGHTSDRLCSPAGIREFIDIVRRRGYTDVLVAACGRAISAELFNDVAAECDINIDQLDIHDFESDEEIAGKAIFACLEDSLPGNGKIGSTNTALVIGGGVAGCQAALDLGNAGVKVYLVERLPSIGGIMAKLDKTFPTLDCSICILGPKLVDVYHHRDIELVTYADIRRISREGPHLSRADRQKSPVYRLGQMRRVRRLRGGLPGGRAQCLEHGPEAQKMRPNPFRAGDPHGFLH